MTNLKLPGRARSSGLLGEFLLIVAGVSVALGADSLWGVRQDRVRAGEYLEQLRSDLAENQQRLRVAIDQEEMQGAAALAAYKAVATGEPILADSAQAWLVDRRGVFYSDPRLLTGTFTGLIESGDTRLIRDPMKRISILAYLPQITADRDEFDRWVGIYLTRISPLRIAGLEAPAYDPSVGGPSVQALVSVPVDPAVPVALDAAIHANRARLIYLRRMLAATDEVAQVLSPK